MGRSGIIFIDSLAKFVANLKEYYDFYGAFRQLPFLSKQIFFNLTEVFFENRLLNTFVMFYILVVGLVLSLRGVNHSFERSGATVVLISIWSLWYLGEANRHIQAIEKNSDEHAFSKIIFSHTPRLLDLYKAHGLDKYNAEAAKLNINMTPQELRLSAAVKGPLSSIVFMEEFTNSLKRLRVPRMKKIALIVETINIPMLALGTFIWAFGGIVD